MSNDNIIRVIAQHMPDACAGLLDRPECVDCARVLRTAATLVEQGQEAGLQVSDAVAACIDFLATEMLCAGGDQAREIQADNPVNEAAEDQRMEKA